MSVNVNFRKVLLNRNEKLFKILLQNKSVSFETEVKIDRYGDTNV